MEWHLFKENEFLSLLILRFIKKEFKIFTANLTLGLLMKLRFLPAACLIIFSFFSHPLLSQYTAINNDPDATFKLAKELYAKKQLSLAYPLFKTLADEKMQSNFPALKQSEIRYYSIICGLELKDETAEQAARKYLELEYNSARVEMMNYHLAEYYYHKNNFAEALNFYENASYDNMSNDEIARMKFHQAYALFTMKRFSEAKPLFNSIRQLKDDENYTDANYYYGFISFSEKRYKDALSSFEVTEDNAKYKGIVPYYIAEIHYYNSEKDKAMEAAMDAIKKGNQFYDLQLKQLIGHIYFEKKQFAKALPYIEEYVVNTSKVSREDLYELSYCYYHAKEYKKSIEGFKELGGKQDSLAQNSMYLLGDAYLQIGQKPSARSAFLFCALNSSNPTQKEISKFNYGKLSYELGYTDVALSELKDFVAAYPKSEYINEARELLANVLAKTNNYKEALDLVSAMPNQTESVKRIYPGILYGRALELINDQQVEQASTLLNDIFQVPYNNNILPFVNFWKGEVSYRQNRFDSAVYFFNNYLRNPREYGQANPYNAKYTLGYSYLKQEDYQDAFKYFQQIGKPVTAVTSGIEQDVYTRLADCYFLQKNYSKALEMYDNILNNNFAAADYALYQKAIIAGATNNYSQKVQLLKSLSARFPSSSFSTDANLEVANTYLANENYEAAIPALQDVLKNKQASSLIPQVYLKLGIAYFNMKQTGEALGYFKKLISGYPNSTESDEAVDYVRNIFVENQRPSDFVAFMRDNGKTISYSQEDSLTYASADLAYSNNSFDKAQASFQQYLQRFPDGQYAVDAHFKLADLYYRNKNFKGAFDNYTAVATKAPNKYAEQSVLQAARIAYFEFKDYALAEKYFVQLKSIAVSEETRLESMRGLLRCQYKLSEWTQALDNAQQLLQQKSVATDDKMMANMVIAKNAAINNDFTKAMSAYKAVVDLGKSEYAAEARYRIAEILFKQNKLSESEKAAFDVINKAGSYEFWITKSYILLGDIYYAQKDYFNAEATLKSVVENATIESLKTEAQQKLDKVTAEKNKNSKIE